MPSLDVNNWYTLQSASSDYYLACGIDRVDYTGQGFTFAASTATDPPTHWQFAWRQDEGYQWAMISCQAYGLDSETPSGHAYCLGNTHNCNEGDTLGSTCNVTMIIEPCTNSSLTWDIEDFGYGTSGAYLSNPIEYGNSSRIYSDDIGDFTLVGTNVVSAGESDAGFEWIISSYSEINDQAWSTWPVAMQSTASAVDSTTMTQQTDAQTTTNQPMTASVTQVITVVQTIGVLPTSAPSPTSVTAGEGAGSGGAQTVTAFAEPSVATTTASTTTSAASAKSPWRLSFLLFCASLPIIAVYA